MVYQYNHLKAKKAINFEGQEVAPPALKKLTLEFIKRNHLPMWLLNTTRPYGRLTVRFMGPDSRPRYLRLGDYPRGLPINASELLGSEILDQGSPELRDYLNNETVTLVWPSDGEHLTSTPEAQAAIQKATRSQYSAGNPIHHHASTPEVKDLDPRRDMIPAGQINAKVMTTVARLSSGDVGVQAALDKLQGLEEDLTQEDFEYVITQTPRGKVSQWATKTLAKLQKSGEIKRANNIRAPKNIMPANVTAAGTENAPAMNPADWQAQMGALEQQAISRIKGNIPTLGR